MDALGGVCFGCHILFGAFLVFSGIKMLLPQSIHISTPVSLGIVGAIILISIGVSLVSCWLVNCRQIKQE
jgi:hypothetical protein